MMKKALFLFSYFVTQLLSYPVLFAFSDVSQDYVYHDSIQSLKDLHIVQGYSDDTYRPEAPVTRAELLKMLVESFPDGFKKDCESPWAVFPDVDQGMWFTAYVCKAFEAGLINGYGDGTFKPGRFINVAELSKIVSHLKGHQGVHNRGAIEPWFQIYLERMEAWHYLLPTFRTPSDLVNRGEMAAMIHRLNQEKRSSWYSAYDTTHQVLVPQSLGPLSAIPWKLNLEVLPVMRLEGRDFEIGEKVFENSSYQTHKISYMSNGLRISGMMSRPLPAAQRDSSVESYPVIVLAHGYYPHDLYKSGTGLKREQDYFARAGFVTIHPDYRGHAESDDDPENRGLYDGALGYTMDIVNLVEALKKTKALASSVKEANGLETLDFLDTDQLFLFGHSMGGATALNIGVMFPELFQSIGLYAPSGGWAWDNYTRWWGDRSGSDWSVLQWRDPAQNPWSWDHLSSKYFLDRLSVPIYLFHGNRDGETAVGVPVGWSDQLAILLRERGKSYEYARFPEQGHVFFGDKWVEMMIKVRDFFVRKN